MTVTPVRSARSGWRPATRARVALWGLAGTLVVAAEISFLASGGGKNPILTVAKLAGLHAALLMMLQLTLVARIPWLDRRLGMDRLTVWHRWTGFTLTWAVAAHAILIVVGYAALDSASLGDTALALAGVPGSILGMAAAATVALIALASSRWARRRLSYEAWHGLHLALYLAVALALTHQFLEPASFQQSPVTTTVWACLWAAVLLALVGNRLLVPVWRNARHRLRVEKVVPESDQVVSVYVAGRDLDRLPARAGQFGIWRFPDHNGWWQANPWSLSAAPDGRLLRLTVKAVGSTSASLRHLPVGTRVFLEGPYGAFTSLQQTRPGALLIAGGVGVTPIRALLEESAGDVVVLYRVRSQADAVLLGELETLAAERGSRVHVLSGRTGEGAAYSSPLDPAPLLETVPDIVDRDVYVCGPPPMTAAVLRSLEALGVPRRQVHSERFSLA